MYSPDDFKLTDGDTIRALIANKPLANFITNGPDGPLVSHLPLVARDEADGLALYGHFARANSHWKVLDGKTSALAVFSGPQGYVSPSWYETKQETGKVVPTWNYVTVHARGIPQTLDHGADSRHAIDALTNEMEAPRDDPWHVSDAPEAYTESMMRGIVAFRMVVATLEAAAKLSQNKSATDFEGVLSGLAHDGEVELSNVMRGSSDSRP